MVASQRDHSRKRLSMLTQPLHLCIRGWFTHQDAVMAIFYLLDGEGVVIRRHGNVSTVEDGRPAVKRVRG